MGLLNQHYAEQAAYYGIEVRDYHRGIPYPGTFVLDEHGIVVEKRFEQSYRVRPTPVAFVERSFASESTRAALVARAETEHLRVVAWLGQATYRPYQQLHLNLDLEIAPGLHVYGHPVPDGSTPLTIEIEPLESLEVGPMELPEPRPFDIGGEEAFFVYEGAVRGSRAFSLHKNLGDVTLGVRVRYQACSDTVCHPPSHVVLKLGLQGLELIRD